MKKFVALFLIVGVAFLAGCTGQDAANTMNNQSVQNPTLIAKMPDGRLLERIAIYSVDEQRYHYIYFFGTNDTKTVSVNYAVSSGKTSFNQTIVLDGKPYELVPK